MTVAYERPWYMSAILTGSGWLGASLLLLAIAMFLNAFDLLLEGLGPLVFGALMLPLLFLAERQISSAFLKETIPPLMIGACLSMVFGTLALSDSTVAALMSWGLVVAITFFGRQTAVVFTLTLTAWMFSFAATGNDLADIAKEAILMGLLSLGTIFSLFPNKYIRATDHSLPTLLALSFVLAFDAFDFGVTQEAALLKGTGAALLSGGLWVLNKKQIDLKLMVLITLLLVALINMSPAILAGLFLLALGWARGDKAYSGIGLIISAALLAQYYTSLDLTLLLRSLYLSATGFALLAFHWVLKR